MERPPKKSKFDLKENELPTVLLSLVFSFLSEQDQQQASQVCKQWYGVIYREVIAATIKDITRGREKRSFEVDLLLDASIEFTKLFPLVESLLRFQYTHRFVPGPGLTKEMIDGEGRYEWGEGCVCDICSSDMICECISRMKIVPYTNQKLKSNDPSIFQIPIIECNERCKCGDSCQLRVVQQGIQLPLQIFWTKAKNWGVRSLEPIEGGQFVCEYIGQVISTTEAKSRYITYDEQHKNYLIVIREHFSSTNRVMRTNMDGTSFGNIARFINHSCEPNLIPMLVRYNSLVPHVAFFAKEEIPAGMELTFDYNLDLGANTDTAVPLSTTPCMCGSKRCRKYLPYNQQV